ncbi:MAG: glutamate-1-semialdehyde 2,1-aminomutase [Acidimicrobiales bacterium]|nr:glutamate-1-semialdehyde 2,1-aminomutase [Acidimicrobiales bacterium]
MSAGAGPTSEALFERARRVIPGGVNSPVRSFQAVGGTPYFVARAEGAYVFDADGRRYLDYVQSWGASILGHAHPAVVEAIRQAAGRGTTYGAPTEGEVLLAEAICARVPGCEQVRLVSSGTEATMSALRLARGATGRPRVVKFDGCYHGHADGLLAGAGSGVATLGLPGSSGVTRQAVAETLVVPYNQVPPLDDEVAAVIVEPVAANMGLVPPAPGFLEGLREACDRSGALLVFDEVITGFRLGPGGATGRYGVRPDLFCFGKVVGGGLPLAAFGGRAEVMQLLAPAGPVYQAGTLSGSPLATAAGLTVLEHLDEAAYLRLSGRVAALGEALRGAADRVGVPLQVPVVGPLLGVAFAERPVADYEGAKAAAAGPAYARFFHAMLGAGVAFAPGAYEVAFPSLAHTEADLEATATVAEEALKEVGAALPS